MSEIVIYTMHGPQIYGPYYFWVVSCLPQLGTTGHIQSSNGGPIRGAIYILL